MELPQQMYADFQAQLPQLKEAFATGATYATDLGQRVIKYDIAVNIGWLLFVIGVSTIIAVMLYKTKKAINKKAKIHNMDMDDENIEWWSVAFLFTVLSVELNTMFIQFIIKGIFVPEWRLIEILSKLVI